MGASQSREVRRLLWIDTEGGIRGGPLWDVCIINETRNGVSMQRYCSPFGVSKRSAGYLRHSLPKSQGQNLRSIDGFSQCLAVSYDCKDGEWSPRTCEVAECSVAQCTSNYLATIEDSAAIVAWGMHTHDRKVLKTHVDEEMLKKFMLLDALKTFKKRISLPKNSLGSCAPGTPRHLFNVKHENNGHVHTAVVDVLNMRGLCVKAFTCLKVIEGAGKQPADVMREKEFCADAYATNGSDGFEIAKQALLEDSVDSVPPTEPVAFEIKASGKKTPPAQNVQILLDESFMWMVNDPSYWSPRKLRKDASKDFKQRLVDCLKTRMGVSTIPSELQARINATQTDVSFFKLIQHVDAHYAPSARQST